MATRDFVLALVFVPVLLASCSRKEAAHPEQGGPKSPVALSLSQATAEHLSEEILFICEAVIDNATGAELTVKSGYGSAFDGLSIVVMDEKGRKLAQQPYTHHQSLKQIGFPDEPGGQGFTLMEGKNARELRFPVSGLPQNRSAYRVQLVGTLPGSDYIGTLCSDLVTARVK